MFRNLKLSIYLTLLMSTAAGSQSIPAGSDILYGVNATSGSTQDWGTINPTTGTFSTITEISPTGLGWPLGDIGSQPDPINGYVYTRQTNGALGGSPSDILAIKKSNGSTQWLGLSADDLVVGYDTKTNKLIYRNSSGGNKLKTYDIANGTTGTISESFASGNSSWQAGGIGAVNSFGRIAYQLRPGVTSTLYKINLDTGEESTTTIGSYVTTIAWDSKKQKLYGLYDSDGVSGFRIAEINTEDGTLTNVSAANSVNGISNYVQMIAPNDQRYYIQENGGVIRAISLEDGSSLGTFTAPLRLMPVGAVVMGADDTTEETVDFDIDDPDATLVKKGTNGVTYTGTNSSSGGVDIEAGTLKVSSSDNLGTGEISLEGGELEISTDTTITNEISSSDDDSAIDTGTNSVKISGVISGSNKINKAGEGTLTLDGSLNNTGGVDVTGGTLVANGTGLTPVTVTSGILEGSGTIGTLTSSGTIAPGNSIGTLNVSGDVTLNSGSILVIEVNANGNSDKIIATGSANLDGTLRISPEPGTYSAGTQYTFITASNVSGTFSEVLLLSCSSGDGASTVYGASSVTVTLSGCTISATNGNIVKSYINDISNPSGDLSSVISVINNLSGTDYNTAIDKLDHDLTGSVITVGQNQLSQINSLVSRRGVSSFIPKGFSSKGFSSSNSELPGKWAQAYYGKGRQQKTEALGVNGYNYNFTGVTIGSDLNADDAVYGAAFSAIQSTVTSAGAEGSAKYNSFALTGYRSHQDILGNTLNLHSSFIIDFIDSERYLRFGSINRTATTDYKAYSLDFGASYSFESSNVPGGNLTTTLISGLTLRHQDGFSETGADSLNLSVNRKRSAVIRMGVDQKYVMQNASSTLGMIPYVNWGVHGSHYLNSQGLSQGFQDQGTFTTTIGDKTNVYGQIGFGFEADLDNGGALNFSAIHKSSGGFEENSLGIEYKMSF